MRPALDRGGSGGDPARPTTQDPADSTDDTAKGDLGNDIRSQTRPDVTGTEIKESSSGADPNNVTVTDTDAGNTVIETQESTTTVTDTEGTEPYNAVATPTSVTKNPAAEGDPDQQSKVQNQATAAKNSAKSALEKVPWKALGLGLGAVVVGGVAAGGD